MRISHSSFNYMRLCEHLEPAFDWRSDDRMLLSLPNFHLFGNQLALQLLYNGLGVSIQRAFDAALALKSIAEDRLTTLTLVPAMIQLMLDHPDAAAIDFGHLRLVIYSGSPISSELLTRAMERLGCDFMQYYGATELNGAAMLLRPGEHASDDGERLKSCGRPMPLVEAHILDADGNALGSGEIGEFVIRTPALTAGYHDNADDTAAVYRNGWYHTGDVGYRDEAGFFFICDRLKDMIVSGSENIYSIEVEKALAQHPAVRTVAVIGVPDARWGEAVKACIVLNEGMSATAVELEAHARTMLAGYKVPKSFDFHDALPTSPTGKILKRELRAPYWRAQARSVA